MQIDMERFRQFARIDATGEDVLLESLLSAAEMTVVDKTNKLPPCENDDLYGVAVMMLAAHWYDNRTPTGVDTREIPYTMSMLLNHIAMCGRYPEVAEHEPYQ